MLWRDPECTWIVGEMTFTLDIFIDPQTQDITIIHYLITDIHVGDK